MLRIPLSRLRFNTRQMVSDFPKVAIPHEDALSLCPELLRPWAAFLELEAASYSSLRQFHHS